MATKEFDTDNSKVDFERVETYFYDVYGQNIQTNNDILGDDIAINSKTTKEFDIFGREAVTREYQADGTLSSKNVNERDQYGQVINNTRYSNEEQIAARNFYTLDEYGRQLVIWEDRNGNSIWDSGDIKLEHTFANSLNSNLFKRVQIIKKANGEEENRQEYYEYDELNRIISSYWDKNLNGK